MDAMRRTTLALACAAALVGTGALPPHGAAAQVPTAGTTPAAPTAPGAPASAPQAPRRFRVAYLFWRKRLQRNHVPVARNLLPQVFASDGSVRPPSAAELRRAIHRMQRRWAHWLRTTERGQSVMFKLEVRHRVPGWGRQHLRNIAWCESKNNPRAIGGGGAYRGMYQFATSTWSVVGGSGDPAAASRWEQTWRAWLLLSRHGSGHWPNCG
jgi:Transglycosylase-like domain